MKEISKTGGPGATRQPNNEAAGSLKRKRTSYARRRRTVLVALLACFVVVVAVYFLAGGDDEIDRGVVIGSVDVGGMTRDEARKAVRDDASATFEEISFGTGKEGFSVGGDALGIEVDAASAVDEAYSVGRRGNIFQQLSDALRSYLGGVSVDLEAGYDEGKATGVMEEQADTFNEKPQNASFSVTDTGKVEVEEARDGRVLDREKTLENLEGSLKNMSGRVAIAEGPPPEPEISTAEVQSYRPKEVIGEYQTDFLWDSNPNRKFNMKLASKSVNNTVLKPGEVFSFNKMTRSLEYKEAKTFSNGGVGIANGGGLCQVSSTLYMAANYAGLKIVERHPHYAVLPYIKPGFDATVWFGENGWGAQDMQFENNTDGYIVVREWVDEKGLLNAQILGQPTGKKVEMSTKKIYEDPVKGIKWTTYKKVTEDGEVIRDGFLYTYRYSFNPPPPENAPHYKTTAPRVAGWSDPTNTTGWASPH
ncbi:MAG: VanW family protein [Actinomycetota bacterium]|nr:VanW family protein [Actinomycetota bacterium]